MCGTVTFKSHIGPCISSARNSSLYSKCVQFCERLLNGFFDIKSYLFAVWFHLFSVRTIYRLIYVYTYMCIRICIHIPMYYISIYYMRSYICAFWKAKINLYLHTNRRALLILPVNNGRTHKKVKSTHCKRQFHGSISLVSLLWFSLFCCRDSSPCVFHTQTEWVRWCNEDTRYWGHCPPACRPPIGCDANALLANQRPPFLFTVHGSILATVLTIDKTLKCSPLL